MSMHQHDNFIQSTRKYCFLLSVYLLKMFNRMDQNEKPEAGVLNEIKMAALLSQWTLGGCACWVFPEPRWSPERRAACGGFWSSAAPSSTDPPRSAQKHSVHLCPTDTTRSNVNVWLHGLYFSLRYVYSSCWLKRKHRDLEVCISSALSVATDRVVWDVLEGLKHLGTCGKKHQQLPNPPGQILCVEVKLLAPCTLL